MKTRHQQILLLVADAVIVFGSYWLAALLRYDMRVPANTQQVVFICIAISIPVVIFFSFILGCYRDLWRYAGIDTMFRQAVIASVSIAVLLIVKYFIYPRVGGTITVSYGLIFFILTSAIRVLPRTAIWFRSLFLPKPDYARRAVIVGAGDTGSMLIKLARNTQMSEGFLPVALIDNNPAKHGLTTSGVKIVGGLDSIVEVCKTYKATEIIVALPNAGKDELYDIYKKCIKTNLPIKSSQSLIDVKDSIHEDNMALRSITIEDLLFREVVENDMSPVEEFLKDKTVLVTGGAGSIGSELCRQVLSCGCRQLIIYDFNENGLYDINEELLESFDSSRFTLCLGSIRDKVRLHEVMQKYKPFIVFHAAAHKHVPMLELNPFEAVKNNAVGTMNVVEACIENNVKKFILISTDKAVNPVNMLGASKRAAELVVENMKNKGNSKVTELAAVRFGNVLGSVGSVIPKFKQQIAGGGPVTVTHPDIIRFFMTISEAVSLVLTAGTLAKDGEIFILDMGKPVKIYDLACDLIRLSGYEPDVDIKIEITGLRPGEKLYEDLFMENEKIDATSHEKIFVLKKEAAATEAGNEATTRDKRFRTGFDEISKLAAESKDEDKLREALFKLIGASPGVCANE